eukprot:TRINITY_DN39575_c0_g1_i5.p1 TRINITY_DN39575_c0_g1~~TRINITY_DN39575_c0_g1_i5.p1  ORF type:complete len:659 (+),score=96.45 TRINITY_DN39575_c0_g1_i5:207-2183(+)
MDIMKGQGQGQGRGAAPLPPGPPSWTTFSNTNFLNLKIFEEDNTHAHHSASRNEASSFPSYRSQQEYDGSSSTGHRPTGDYSGSMGSSYPPVLEGSGMMALELAPAERFFQEAENPFAGTGFTTAMIQQIPMKYTQRRLMKDINQLGFLGQYDFLYLPLDARKDQNRGFAFVNFVFPEAAEEFYQKMHDRTLRHQLMPSTVIVCPAKVQGFAANLAQFDEGNMRDNGKKPFRKPTSRPFIFRDSTQPILYGEGGGSISSCFDVNEESGETPLSSNSGQVDLSGMDLQAVVDFVGTPEQSLSGSQRPDDPRLGSLPGAAQANYGVSTSAGPQQGLEGSSRAARSNATQSSRNSQAGNASHRWPEALAPPEWGNATTVMMRHLPNKYTQSLLHEELGQDGFKGCYDFLYLPIDAETAANKGYAFINFVSSEEAWRFKLTYEGCRMKRFNSSKTVAVSPAVLQGFEANYVHYSGSPLARPIFLRGPEHQLNQPPTTRNKAPAAMPYKDPAPVPQTASRGQRGQWVAEESSGGAQRDLSASWADFHSRRDKLMHECQNLVQLQRTLAKQTASEAVHEQSTALRTRQLQANYGYDQPVRGYPLPLQEQSFRTDFERPVSADTYSSSTGGRRFCPYCGRGTASSHLYCSCCGYRFDPSEDGGVF